MIMLGLFLSNICSAQSVKEAVRALQKLQARTEAGISRRDYAPALGDTRFEVNQFLQSSEAKVNPKLTASIIKTLNYYQMAADAWKYSNRDDVIPWVFIYGESPDGTPAGESAIKIHEYEFKSILEAFPEIKEKNFASKENIELSKKVRGVPTGVFLAIIWNGANKELKSTLNLLHTK